MQIRSRCLYFAGAGGVTLDAFRADDVGLFRSSSPLDVGKEATAGLIYFALFFLQGFFP